MKKKFVYNGLKKVLVVSLLGALAASLFGCGTKADNQASTNTETTAGASEDLTIRVAGGYNSIYGPQIIIAQELGYFDEVFADLDYKVTVETYEFAGGPAYNEALLSNSVDAVIGIGDQPSISGILNGDGAVIVSRVITNNHGVGIVVRDGAGIEKPEDLKGKTIATGIGTAYQKCLDLYLADYGLTEDDISIVNLFQTAEVLAAFEKGEVDATATSISYLRNQAEEAGLGHLLDDFSSHPNYAYLIMKQDFLEEHEEVSIRFIQALYEANEWYNANRDEAYDILAKNLEIEKKEVQINNDDVEEVILLNEDDLENAVVTYKFLQDNDILPAEIDDITSIYNDYYVNEAIKRAK